MGIPKFENQIKRDRDRFAAQKPDHCVETNVSFRDTKVFGLRFRDAPLDEVADSLIDDAIANVKRKVYFVNAHCINVANRDKAYSAILREAPFLYADGLGMALAARIMGTRLENNVNGTDLFPLLCERAARTGLPVAFFGAAPGNALSCAERMVHAYPGLNIVWGHHGYVSLNEQPEIIDEINSSGARILLVAKGVPSQELWIDENASKLDVPVLMGVGALFDFYSGSVKRAPLLWRKLRIEWAFRLLMEPRRLFKRYVLGNPAFLLRTIKARLTGIN